MFLCLGQEISASSAVEFLRIECVEEAEQLNFCSLLPRVRLGCSNHADECRSNRSLRDESERRGDGPCQQDCAGLDVFNTSRDVGSRTQEEREKSLEESKREFNSGGVVPHSCRRNQLERDLN